MIKSLIKTGEYYDSVSLMIVGKEITEMDGVIDAAVVMATLENKAILKMSNLYLPEFDNCSDTDLLLVVNSEDEQLLENLEEIINDLLFKIRNKKSSQGSYSPKSIDGVVDICPECNLVLISIAGKYAGKQAMKALQKGLNVMLFSDNVSLETEINLKNYALENDLLMMGPDCGTAIINGIPLAFANVVNKGDIGIIAASGTGLQEVSSIISNNGCGISQAIGTGGRDVKEQVGGMMFISSLRALNEDENTKIIVLISKPPHPIVLDKIKLIINGISKPVVCIFLGTISENVDGVLYCETLEEAALTACALSENKPADGVKSFLSQRKLAFSGICEEELENIASTGKYVRGVFSGGTLCDEALIILSKNIDIYSNRAIKIQFQLENSWFSKEHTVVDLGEDEFTVGRLHPMIDFELRNKRILQEAEDPETAVILFDLVLGYGANENPVGEILPVIREAQNASEGISFICSVTRKEEDLQGIAMTIESLELASIKVMHSNAAAAE